MNNVVVHLMRRSRRFVCSALSATHPVAEGIRSLLILLSAVISFSAPHAAAQTSDYCAASGSPSTNDYIAGFQLASLQTAGFRNTSGYTDFTKLLAPHSVSAGSAAVATLVPGFEYGTHSDNWAIWIDANNNRAFESNEQIFHTEAGTPDIQYASFFIPAGATGTTRLRVRMWNGSEAAGPCGRTSSAGEVYDFPLTIQPRFELVRGFDRVSVSSSGAEALNYSSNPAISGDGRYVTFASLAENLVPNDSNGRSDIFRFDRQTRQIALVSKNLNGSSASGLSGKPAISADGNCVAFISNATDLVANGGSAGSYERVFLHDFRNGKTELVSVNDSGLGGSGSTRESPSISDDCRVVAFSSEAEDLVIDDAGGTDVFVRDLQSRRTVRVTANSYAVQSRIYDPYSDTFQPNLSGNGRYVTYSSSLPNLVVGDTNGARDVFVHDLLRGTTIRGNLNNGGLQAVPSASAELHFPMLNSDGRYLTFNSAASNLVFNNGLGLWEIFVRDLKSGATLRTSVSSAGAEQRNGGAFNSVISGDGRFTVFDSRATNLIDTDTNSSGTIFVHDLLSGATAKVFKKAISYSSGNSFAISKNGSYIAFNNRESGIVSGDTNGQGDIFVVPNPLLQGAANQFSPPTPAPTPTRAPIPTSNPLPFNLIQCTQSAYRITAGGTVTFKAFALNNGGKIYASWSVTNNATGAITNGPSPVHEYTLGFDSPGTYTVNTQATNFGKTSCAIQVDSRPPPPPPVTRPPTPVNPQPKTPGSPNEPVDVSCWMDGTGVIGGGRDNASVRLNANGVATVNFHAFATGMRPSSEIIWLSNVPNLELSHTRGGYTEATFRTVGKRTISAFASGKGATHDQANCVIEVLPPLSANPKYECVGPTRTVEVGQLVGFTAKRDDLEVVRPTWKLPGLSVSVAPDFRTNVGGWYTQPGSYTASFVDPVTRKGASCAVVKVKPRPTCVGNGCK